MAAVQEPAALTPAQAQPEAEAEAEAVPEVGLTLFAGGNLARTPELTTPEALLALWLKGRGASTLRAYRGDLDQLCAWAGRTGDPSWILKLTGPEAQRVALDWRRSMLEAGLAPRTINRRLAAVRSLTRLAKLLSVTDWQVEVPGVRDQPVRDARGPAEEQIGALLEAAKKSRTPVRDQALLATVITLGLRREEVARLRLEDFDSTRNTMRVLGKGGTLVHLTVPATTLRLLRAWLAVRVEDGTERIFQLKAAGVYYRICTLGRIAGIKLHPHGLRHAAVTAGLDATGGDVRRVKAFSRHAKVETVLRYDDAREDHAGQISQAVDDRLLKDKSEDANGIRNGNSMRNPGDDMT